MQEQYPMGGQFKQPDPSLQQRLHRVQFHPIAEEHRMQLPVSEPGLSGVGSEHQVWDTDTSRQKTGRNSRVEEYLTVPLRAFNGISTEPTRPLSAVQSRLPDTEPTRPLTVAQK